MSVRPEHIEKTAMVVRVEGCPDGVSDEVLERCLGHMLTWLALADSVLDAEFPEFEFATLFSVFSVFVPQLTINSDAMANGPRSEACGTPSLSR